MLNTYTNLLTILTMQPATKQAAEQKTYIMLHHQLWLKVVDCISMFKQKILFSQEQNQEEQTLVVFVDSAILGKESQKLGSLGEKGLSASDSVTPSNLHTVTHFLTFS